MAVILIVDDEAPSRRLASFVLQLEDFVVLTAANGSQALDHLDRTPVDLIITDLHMPLMDGDTFLHQVRSDERFTGLPIIVLTGSAYDDDRRLVTGRGIDAYLMKPTSSEELVATVKRLLHE
jgi:CheY-like chemotaxis protein